MAKFHAIIPAGGVGTRLWPLSTPERPKFLLDVTDSGKTLLEQTIERLCPIADRMTIVTGVATYDDVKKVAAQFSTTEDGTSVHRPIDVIAEPEAKNSLAAIGLATLIAHKLDPDCIVGSFAADHVIDDVKQFHQRVQRAIQVADSGYIVTLGVKPRYAATQFGYCQRGSRLDDVDFKAYELERFVEKPQKKRAKKYISSGNYFWNAGMYISKASVLRKNIKRYCDKTYDILSTIVDMLPLDSIEHMTIPPELWRDLPSVSIDTALAEPAAIDERVAVVPTGKIGWDDMGDLEALLRYHNIKGPLSIRLDNERVHVEKIDYDDDKKAVYIDAPQAQISTSRDTLGDIVHMRLHQQSGD